MTLPNHHARRLAAFGDSITKETPGNNASWALRIALPPYFLFSVHGQQWATAPFVYQNMWTPEIATGRLRHGDIAVVMTHTPDYAVTSFEDASVAVLKMHQEASYLGFVFIFATQNAWATEQQSLQPDSRDFYDQMKSLLPPDVPFVDNDAEWKDRGWDTNAALYTDGIHLSEAGGWLLGAGMTRAINDVLAAEDGW